MGLLRTLLAFSVFISHTEPLLGMELVGGQAAVQAFYVISGFYMFLILNGKYSGARATARFWYSRFLRLYPVYLLVLLMAFFAMLRLAADPWTSWYQYGGGMAFSTKMTLILTQILPFGQDILLLFGFNPETGLLSFGPAMAVPASAFFLIPTAWTLGLEFSFYLLAPFFARLRTRWILLVIALSLLLRWGLAWQFGLSSSVWDYRFFPFELALFLLGGFSYRAYQKWKTAHTPVREPLVVWAIVLATAVIAPYVVPQAFLPVFSVVAVALSLPVLFSYSRSSRIDRFIGELSYSFYLSHLLFLELNRRLLLLLSPGQILFIVLAFSVLVVLLIERPMNAVRWSATRATDAVPPARRDRRLRVLLTGGFVAACIVGIILSHPVDSRTVMTWRIKDWARLEQKPDAPILDMRGRIYTPRQIEALMDVTSGEGLQEKNDLIDFMWEAEIQLYEEEEALKASAIPPAAP